jgi:hypothetical protein
MLISRPVVCSRTRVVLSGVGEVTSDSVRVDFWHSRRTDHHRGGTRGLRPPRVFDACTEAVGGGARHDRHAAVHTREHSVERGCAFGLGQPGDFARDTEGREPVHAVSEKQVDDTMQALEIDFT